MSSPTIRGAGEAAPPLVLRASDGSATDLDSLFAKIPSDGVPEDAGASILLYWIKIACPTCRLAAPFVNRLTRILPGRVFLIGQDAAADLQSFAAENGYDALQVFEEEAPYVSADAYGLTHLPTWFRVERIEDGAMIVRDSGIGFEQEAFERILTVFGGGGAVFSEEEKQRLPVMQPG